MSIEEIIFEVYLDGKKLDIIRGDIMVDVEINEKNLITRYRITLKTKEV